MIVDYFRTGFIGTMGTTGTIALESVNTIVAILCGLATLTYLCIKIAQEATKLKK